MTSPFSVPIYEPLPYVLSGLSFAQLPLYTQRYLSDIAKLVPPHAHGLNTITAERSIISTLLSRSLEGNDIALVRQRREATNMGRDYEQGIPFQNHAQWHAAAQEMRLQTVLGVLLPQRGRILDEFMIKFDALVWLDQEGRQNYTPGDWQRYRDALLTPILDRTSDQLVALDESVRNRSVSDECYYRGPPNSLYSRFGSSRTNASRVRSWRS
ncbi:hypothetical protein EDB19DRAFT_1627767 [Suillus lakei]|nr:hypothetical protein EDB19DRAFT_1627767 [Suillus lakei]